MLFPGPPLIHQRLKFRKTATGFVALLMMGTALFTGQAKLRADDFRRGEVFRQQGTDPTFNDLKQRRAFPIGEQSTAGVLGSAIDVNNDLVERGLPADRTIPQDIIIHTLCHSHIRREDFGKWTRWYQEDGNTQVFRLFKDEHNVRNDRPGAARIEAYSDLRWRKGEWHAWEGRYTIVKPHRCMIFQAKNDDNDWSVSIDLNDNGDITLNHRLDEREDITLARNMTGRPFTLGVRDNGHNYEVYFNGRKVGEGEFNRPTGYNRFRWGMYDGTMRHDAMILVSGIRFE